MKNKKLILVAVALVVLVAVFLGVWFATRPTAIEGGKAFTVTVVHGDKTEKTYNYTTDETMLGAFLEAEGLIDSKGADAGMFHTVDGEKADWSVNQSYWAFYVGGEYAITGIYDTTIEEGAVYKLEYTIG